MPFELKSEQLLLKSHIKISKEFSNLLKDVLQQRDGFQEHGGLDFRESFV